MDPHGESWSLPLLVPLPLVSGLVLRMLAGAQSCCRCPLAVLPALGQGRCRCALLLLLPAQLRLPLLMLSAPLALPVARMALQAARNAAALVLPHWAWLQARGVIDPAAAGDHPAALAPLLAVLGASAAAAAAAAAPATPEVAPAELPPLPLGVLQVRAAAPMPPAAWLRLVLATSLHALLAGMRAAGRVVLRQGAPLPLPLAAARQEAALPAAALPAAALLLWARLLIVGAAGAGRRGAA